MSDFGIESNGDDVMLTNGDCNIFLSTCIDGELEMAERFMCEANAKAVYDTKCALELAAHRLQKWYDEWKNKEFKNER